MVWELQLTNRAERDFGALPRPIQERFGAAITQMADDPRKARPGLDVKRLEGSPGAYRLRVGPYRAVFQIQGAVVLFTRFAHRSTAYRV